MFIARLPLPSLPLLFVLFLFMSCGSGVRAFKVDLVPLQDGFRGTFHDPPYRSHERNPIGNSLLSVLSIFEANADTATLQLESSGALHITYHMDGAERTKTYQGRFSKRGFFEYRPWWHRVQIPPLVPFIYSSERYCRVRIALTIEGDLVVDNKWARDGNILFLAGGSSGRSQYYFHAVNK